jgi:hypothetical protein
VSWANQEVVITDPLMRSVEKVIDTIRGRRGPAAPPADPPQTAAAGAAPTPPPAAASKDDVPQLHLAATVAAADADDA